MKILVQIAILLFALVCTTTAKVYTKCEFAKKMYDSGITKSQLPDWACIADHESEYNSAAKGGSSYYGIFQIGSKYWCDQPKNKGCNIKCSKLLDDDITDDIACAKVVYKEQKFGAWTTWKKYCKNAEKTHSVSDCKL